MPKAQRNQGFSTGLLRVFAEQNICISPLKRENGAIEGQQEQCAVPERISLEATKLKFEAGEIVITPAASSALDANGQTLDALLQRHCLGDWGDVPDQLRSVNEQGLAECFALQSVFTLADGNRLTLVTNRDRTLTMVHLQGAV